MWASWAVKSSQHSRVALFGIGPQWGKNPGKAEQRCLEEKDHSFEFPHVLVAGP